MSNDNDKEVQPDQLTIDQVLDTLNVLIRAVRVVESSTQLLERGIKALDIQMK